MSLLNIILYSHVCVLQVKFFHTPICAKGYFDQLWYGTRFDICALCVCSTFTYLLFDHLRQSHMSFILAAPVEDQADVWFTAGSSDWGSL